MEVFADEDKLDDELDGENFVREGAAPLDVMLPYARCPLTRCSSFGIGNWDTRRNCRYSRETRLD